MARVYLGLGSNIERERYITAGLDALAGLFGELDISPVYESAAIGFDGQPFLNLVVGVTTDLSLAELAKRLRHIEYEHGRPKNATRFSARQLDIDILTYDGLVGVIDGVELPRGEILENAFVLRPLADLVPKNSHPADGRSFETLWTELGLDAQRISRVAFSWRGREIS
ncbi:2-amino-4-hydroxy-6-hydroxymethyldihydropteridine diphosphokinase [Seongchinamella unica]|uniref:2-amino-4-hydroxy-6-hydroxymethyldihydropteridine diphosphokinase n=1 Tax=Seongchinamella unica TaxID=2547392 RepID=A0A4R5LN63_9GAMM|nr:2-amino-4-hydroxy-6-hydroxymethyldihydropteridine diphosphokinase [Seongchinamella unica]TDG11628.1 2-amino-4-hydroxy-6-hydroxymethyldihydropteridine diphosphokinase [Seongchinamella unica]